MTDIWYESKFGEIKFFQIWGESEFIHFGGTSKFMLGESIGLAVFGESFGMDSVALVWLFSVRAKSFGMLRSVRALVWLCLVRAWVCYVW